MPHGERGSTGTTVVFLLLGIVLGAALGYWYASRSAPAPIPASAPAQTREVNFRLEGKSLVYDHPAIYMTVDRKDRIRWRSDKFKGFTITLAFQRSVDETKWPSEKHPENPFGPGTASWTTETGTVELGPPLPAARGYQYKFTIRAGDYVYDPHIIFE